MYKKIFSLILSLLMLNIYCIPAYSAEKKDIKIKAEYMTYLNANKASDGETVQFMSLEDYTDETGFTIPHGTVFKGEIKSHKESKPLYRRAKVKISVDEMILPDGRTYKLDARTKRRFQKGSAIGNVAKGIGTFPCAIVTSAVGGVVMVVEAITIIGLIFVAPTGAGFCKSVGRMTKGLNCKRHRGDKITLKIKDMKEYRVQEVTFIEKKNKNDIDK